MKFDIITTFKNNIEWCDPFFRSLENTLLDKSRKIIVYDNSDEREKNILVEKLKKFNLNIDYFHDPVPARQNYLNQWMRSLEFPSNDKICFVHSDIVFFMKEWDLKLEMKLDNYHVVAVGESDRIKSYFMLTDKEIFSSTRFGFKRTADKSRQYECSGIIENRENETCLFQERRNLGGKGILGDFYYFEGSLFFYHNSWASRSHLGNSCPIPEKEKRIHYKRISNTKFLGHFFNVVVNCENEEQIKEIINKVLTDEIQIVLEDDFIFDNYKELLTYLEQRLSKYYKKIYILKDGEKINKFIPFVELKNIDPSKDIRSQIVEQCNLSLDCELTF